MNAPIDRVIRVFVSSTFRDMAAEREELAKFVFPQLRRLCEVRGVVWGEVDLRWGITDEQKAEGRVLPICLEQIRRCRPYFLGLLGERYGWVPDSLPEDLTSREGWLRGDEARSVTELEILHGVLNDPEMATHGFFYFRDPAFVTSLPERERAAFLEGPTTEELSAQGPAEAARRANLRKERLSALKERIRQSGLPLRENYRDPRELGRLVLEDMTRLIDTLFPEGAKRDTDQLETAGHEDYIRVLSRAYIARPSDYCALDRHVASSDPPLLVTGEHGCGKSALLANWVRHFREHRPEIPIIAHFVRATPSSVEEPAMLRRLASELDRTFNLGLDMPEDARGMRGAFSHALSAAAARGSAVLVIDGLDRLEGKSGPSDANWLPEHVPPGMRMVLGCAPDPVLDSLTRRGWPLHGVAPLTVDDRRGFIRQYLALYAKAVSSRHEEMILASEHSANPLFLKTLLEELRLFGSHEELEGRLSRYLEAPTIPALFTLVLERYEEDYERDRPGLVGDAFSLFYVADRGLAESELLDLLGSDGSPLPQAIWAPLLLAAEGLIADRGGVLSLNSPLIRTALVAAFPWPSSAIALHRRLAEYFRTRENGPRKIEELPKQLWMAGDMAGLRDAMADLPFFKAMVEHDLNTAANFWDHLEREGFDFFDAYRPVLSDPFEHGDYVFPVFQVMNLLDHIPQSVTFGKLLVTWLKINEDAEGSALALNNLGNLFEKANQLEEALSAFEEAEAQSRTGNSRAQLARSLNGRTSVLERLGRIDEALASNRSAASIYRELGDRGGLMRAALDSARIYDKRGNKDAARPLLKEAETIARETGDLRNLIGVLTDLADSARLDGDLDSAGRYLDEIESLHRQGVPGHRFLGAFLSLKGRVEADRDHTEEALRLFGQLQAIGREQEDIQLEAEGKILTAIALYNSGEYGESLALYQDVTRAARDMKDRIVLLASLTGEARCHHALRDTETASRLYSEAEDLSREMGLTNRLVELLGDHANLMYAARRFNEAHSLWDQLDAAVLNIENARTPLSVLTRRADCALIEADWDLARRLAGEIASRMPETGGRQALHDFLSVRARLFYHDQQYSESLSLYSRMEALAKENDDRRSIAEALVGEALCHHFLKDDEQAVALLAAAESISRGLKRWDKVVEDMLKRLSILKEMGRTGDALQVSRDLADAAVRAGRQDQVRAALSEQFDALHKLSRDDEAGAALAECERLCREAGDVPGLRICLSNRAAVLTGNGKHAEAVPMLVEAADLARKAGGGAELARTLGHLAGALYNSARLVEARAALSEREALCRALGDARGLAETITMRAWDLGQTGDDAGAIALASEAEELYRKLNDTEGLRNTLLYRAERCYRLGRHAEAASDSEQCEVLDRQAHRKDRLEIDLGVRAACLWALNRQAESLKLYEEQASLLREADHKANLAVCLSYQGKIHRALGNTQRALQIYPEAELVARDAGDKATLADILANWSEILLGLSAWDEALPLWERAERNAEDRRDQRSLWYYLYVQAHTLAYRKQNAQAALVKIEELLKLPREASPDENHLKGAVEMRDQLVNYLRHRG